MKLRLLAALLLAAALPAPAATTVGVVNINLVVEAHPSTVENTAELSERTRKFLEERDSRRRGLEAKLKAFEDAAALVQSPVLQEPARKKAAADALRADFEAAQEEHRRFVALREGELQRRKSELLADVMADIRAKVEALAKERGIDLVVARSDDRVASSVTTVLYVAPSVDLTDALIAAIGGDRAAAEASLDKAKAFLDGEGPAPEGSEAALYEARGAAPAQAPAPAPAAPEGR